MTDIDYTQPPDTGPVLSNLLRAVNRAIFGRIGYLPNAVYSADPDEALGSATDRASAFAGRVATIEAGAGLVPGGAIDLANSTIGGGPPKKIVLTTSINLTVSKWASYNGSLLVSESASPITITVNDSAITGTAQGGAAGTPLHEAGTSLPSIQLAAGASSVDDEYKHMIVEITSGTGIGQKAAIESYDGTTKTAYVTRVEASSKDWDTVPDATSGYSLTPKSYLYFASLQEGAGSVTIAAAGSLSRVGSSGSSAEGGFVTALTHDTKLFVR